MPLENIEMEVTIQPKNDPLEKIVYKGPASELNTINSPVLSELGPITPSGYINLDLNAQIKLYDRLCHVGTVKRDI